MSASPPLETLPDALLDTLVSYILQTCPALAAVLLSALGTRIHASAVRVLFTSMMLPDDARYFLAFDVSHLVPSHPVSALLLNPERYARAVKRIIVTDAGLPPPFEALEIEGSSGLLIIDEEDSDTQVTSKHTRVAVQPMLAKSLNQLLTVCTNLEQFIWSSANPPPDGVCEVLAEHCPRLVNFVFQPDAPLRTTSGTQTATVSPPSRHPSVPKWDAPSLPLLAALPITKLHITRLSQQGSRALAVLFTHLSEYSLLEDVSLDFVWLDDSLCAKVVEAGRRIRRLKIGTCGTKLTDKGLVSIFEGCDALEEFALVEAQGRLTRNLWSKFASLPPHLSKFQIAMSESGPHHSWTADHLLSFPKLQLDALSHLSVLRIVPPPHFSPSSNVLEYDSRIDDVATLKSIPKEVVAVIRGTSALTVLECDWWSWKPEDVKSLLERCTQLELLKLSFDAPFSKLLTMTSAFTALTRLLKLSVSIPQEHALGPIPVPASPVLKSSSHPLTPAASPVRRRTSLPSPDLENHSQFFCADEIKLSGSADPSLPPTREVKRFVKKCPRLVELEWYGRNARGKWLISRSVTTSKINTNVAVEYYPPVASPNIWKRASREKAALEAIQTGGCLSENIERQGQAWTGLKAEQYFADRAAEKEKEKEELASPVEKSGRSNGLGKRSSMSLASISASASITISTEKPSGSGSSHSPLQPFTPLSPPTSARSLVDPAPVPALEAGTRPSGQSTQTTRRSPSEPSLRTNGSGSRGRNNASSGQTYGGSTSSNSRGRNANTPNGHRDGRGRGGSKGPRRSSTANGGESTRNGGGGRGHGTGRGGRRKAPTATT